MKRRGRCSSRLTSTGLPPLISCKPLVNNSMFRFLKWARNTDPVEIVRQGLATAKENKNDYVLIDTAGRLQIDEKLMTELKNIKELAHPNDILLVVDAMTGQAAVDVAKGFNEQLDITGVVLTKLDGDTRGGAALSIRAVTGKPIKFIGQGERWTP